MGVGINVFVDGPSTGGAGWRLILASAAMRCSEDGARALSERARSSPPSMRGGAEKGARVLAAVGSPKVTGTHDGSSRRTQYYMTIKGLH